MATGSYRVEPDVVRSVSNTVKDLNSAASSVTSDLESLVIDALAFAGIGGSVAGANASLRQQLVGGLGKFVSLIEDISSHVDAATNGYETADTATAQGYGGGASGGGRPATLDSRVVDSIMASEGAGGEQGGVREAYGFRENMHNGYDQIMAARRQYGVGSEQEHAVVTELMTERARQAGALHFTDPGAQAAVMSGAHMRGVGGVQAILNHMAGADITRSATLSPDTIGALRGMTPEDFQQRFHDARIEYDRQIYGGTTTHQAGHTQNWWDRYGHGLTTRYDREQQEFLTLSR
ncbi:hypothetical protein [Amycolatopsis sp. CA-230715]|uniref:hypothetical protein n=1 Tax=Amycolatopsis sp. CA-230715 TaxID=2745196 RepID=UPI001C02E494|nr:hypothetical protein [Amycolatopsis sp. CA-230715]QWF80197.1 hypothetical protein HUW46_03616 [Amycolatopsis sp. CA-230715]